MPPPAARGTLLRMVRRLLAAAALIAAALMPARLDAAACHSEIAQQEPRRAPIVKVGWMKRAAADPGEVGLTFLGHASFLIESPQGVTIVTDYNDYLRAPFAPDIATMNLAHSTHYSENPEKGIKYLLRGWDERGGVAQHELTYKDVRVTSIPTNIRDFGGGTRRAGNSIFAFQVEGICVVHLGHLHHTLTEKHLADLEGKLDRPLRLVPLGLAGEAEEVHRPGRTSTSGGSGSVARVIVIALTRLWRTGQARRPRNASSTVLPK